MENELRKSQYDNDFKCYDDDQIYDENFNEQHVDNNVENSDNTSVNRKKWSDIVRNCSGKPELVFKYE